MKNPTHGGIMISPRIITNSFAGVTAFAVLLAGVLIFYS